MEWRLFETKCATRRPAPWTNPANDIQPQFKNSFLAGLCRVADRSWLWAAACVDLRELARTKPNPANYMAHRKRAQKNSRPANACPFHSSSLSLLASHDRRVSDFDGPFSGSRECECSFRQTR